MLTFYYFNNTLKQNFYINFILLVLLKNISIYIIFFKLLLSLKKIKMTLNVCYNLKITNIFVFLILIKIRIYYKKLFIFYMS